jgi:arsenite-transporting ATPase
VERDDGGFALSLELPFVAKDEVKVRCAREELIVQVGGWRRNLLLPRLLADRTPEDARLVGGVLQIHFGGARRRSEEESRDA